MRNENCLPKDEKETIEYLDESVDKLDEQRLSGLKEIQTIQSVKNEILQKEKDRLSAKHGENHPEVLNAENRIMYNKEMFPGLKMEIEKASIKQAPFDRTSWRVHGRVFENENKPLKGVTVYLSDENKKWIEAIGNSCTTGQGYYSLTADKRTLGKIEKGQNLYLTVSDRNKKVIYSADEPLTAREGVIIYRDIYLEDEECTKPSSGSGKIRK